MMDSFPHLLNEMGTDRVGHIALWLHATAPLLEDAPRGGDDMQTEFSYTVSDKSLS
jgi:hypothetical protein